MLDGADDPQPVTILGRGRVGRSLAAALTAAGVEHMVEFYPAGHGFAVPDNPPYDKAAADRHWAALEKLFAALP